MKRKSPTSATSTTSEPRPSVGTATLAAFTVLAFFVVIGIVLLFTADDPDLWGRHIKLFDGFAPLAGGAIGWIFGREVHRRAATDYKNAAAAYRGKAQQGHDLAVAVKCAAAAGALQPKGGSMSAVAGVAPPGAPDPLDRVSQLAEEVLSAIDPAPMSAQPV